MQSIRFQKGLKRVLKRVWSDIRRNGKYIAVVAVCMVIMNWVFGTVCPIAICFGVPCPGCGMTRAVLAVFHGQFQLAARYNAAVYIWAIYALYWFIDRYIFEKKRKNISMILLIVVCLFTIAYYIFRICTGTLVEVTSLLHMIF